VATKAAVSDEEIQLRKRARRRLVGAIALVVLVVAAVPMVLDHEPKARTEQIEVKIPPIPPAPASNAPAPTSPQPAAAAPATPPAPTGADPSAPQTAAASPPVERAPEPQPAPPQSVPPPPAAHLDASPPAGSASKSSTAASKEGYVVQLIATSSATKARELRKRLQRQKFPAYTEKTPDGGKTRVRVGPFETREAAEQARQRLAKLDYDPGKVVRRGD
jgi:DedD protein